MNQERNEKILIVDDITKNIQLVANILKREGYKVYFATNGEMAIENSKSINFDLILLDIMMPGKDGFEVCKELKLHETTREIPIIFLTAKNDQENIKKGFVAGGVDYITKPFSKEELVARIQTHLDLKESRDLLKKKNLELQKAIQTKNLFFSIIAHDLKDPFAGIINASNLILKNREKIGFERCIHYMKLIYKSSIEAQKLLLNLLDWSGIQTGDIHFTPTSFSLNFLIDETYAFFETIFLNKNLSFQKFLDDDFNVHADLNMISIVLRNIISNAIKFSFRGSEIRAHIYCEKDFGCIKIIDSGIGIPEDILNNLFDPSIKKNREGTETESGSSIGLVLSHEFIKINHGEIIAESKVNQGTSFTIKLPLQDQPINS